MTRRSFARFLRRSGAFVLGTGLALVGSAGAADAAPPRCRLEVEVQPERPRVGEQILYTLRILRRHDVTDLGWERPLTFPTFRAEWLPGRASERAVLRSGETYQEYSERRALFAAHAGTLDLPPAAVRCASPSGEEIARAPRRQLVVEPLPTEGRPHGFDGAVGRVELTLTAVPKAIALGESVRLSVVVRGPGNLWNSQPRFIPELAPSEVEVFPRPPESARDAGRTLIVRRYFAFDLVPRAAGTLELPTVELAYFDPEAEVYRTARASGGRVSVAPERARRPTPAAPEAPETPAQPAPDTAPLAWVLWGTGVCGAVAFALVFWRRRHAAPDTWVEVSRLAALARDSESAEDRGRAACAALRTALGRTAPRALALSAEELLAVVPPAGPGRAAAELIGRIESARFGAGGSSWSHEELEEHLAALRDC